MFENGSGQSDDVVHLPRGSSAGLTPCGDSTADPAGQLLRKLIVKRTWVAACASTVASNARPASKKPELPAGETTCRAFVPLALGTIDSIGGTPVPVATRENARPVARGAVPKRIG